MRLTRQVNAAAKEAERAQKAYEKGMQLEAKEQQRLFVESRVAAVNLQNEELQDYVAQLESVLECTLSVDDYLDIDSLKEPSTAAGSMRRGWTLRRFPHNRRSQSPNPRVPRSSFPAQRTDTRRRLLRLMRPISGRWRRGRRASALGRRHSL